MDSSELQVQLDTRVKRRVYLPEAEDQYDAASKPLTDVVLDDAIDLPTAANDLKSGFVSDVTTDAGMSPCAVMLGLLYVHRLVHKNPGYVTATSSRDIFLASMMIASKYLNDEGEEESLLNSDWAKIGRKTKHSVDCLEIEFISALDWELYVSLPEYLEFIATIEGRIATSQMQWRGWSTYSDMVAIWNWMDTEQAMFNFVTETTKIILQGTVVYMMCFTTLFALSTAVIHCLEQSHTPTTSLPEVVTSDFSPVDYFLYHGNSLKSSALFVDTAAQLGLDELFLPSRFLQRQFSVSHNRHFGKKHSTKSRVFNGPNDSVDLWYWGIAKHVWNSISDLYSTQFSLNLKHSAYMAKEYLQEALKVDSEILIHI